MSKSVDVLDRRRNLDRVLVERMDPDLDRELCEWAIEMVLEHEETDSWEASENVPSSISLKGKSIRSGPSRGGK